MTMRQLYLVRHATPAVQPNVPAIEWPLADRGIEEARALAEIARAWDLRAVYASREPKAQSTALIIAEPSLLPVHVVDGFEELRIDHWIGNSDEFGDTVREILAQPALSLRGAERAETAAERFASAIRIVEQGPFPAAAVTHGRVLSAWLGATLQLEDPFALWRSIPMPGWTRLDLDRLEPGIPPAFHSEAP
ncbi:MAG: histidine phosphatase family protein [Chloroflexi bacterium]|nr:histidine phosphatase family protein [Chloroflexota bacterium]